MKPLSLENLAQKYKAEIYRLSLEEPKKFIDFTHNENNQMCKMYYLPKAKRYKLEPI